MLRLSRFKLEESHGMLKADYKRNKQSRVLLALLDVAFADGNVL